MKTRKFLMALALLLAIAQGAWAEGELTGRFTVNASGKQVCFSQGNLQATYDGSAWSWALAENQWDYIGNGGSSTVGNEMVTSEYPYISGAGTVDLFGWVGNTSNWTDVNMYGITSSTATNAEDGYGNSISDELKRDWGNTIGDGWRTLTTDEWVYLLDTRLSGAIVDNSPNARYTYATINTDGTSVNGIILFPDGVTIATSEATTWTYKNEKISSWGYAAKCTTAQWTALAAKGCVFLPAAGLRKGTEVDAVNYFGYYYSSSPSVSYAENAYYMRFIEDNFSSQNANKRNFGCSVRLVKDCHTVSFDIDDYDDDPASQTVAHGMKATEPASNRDGYHVSVWKLGEDDYDFNTPVTSDITLTGSWTANTYTVVFNANGGSGTMANMNLTYDGDYATLTAFNFTAPDGKAFKEWNTVADGSGTSYDDKQPVYNLTSTNGATVMLYAQWGKDIATCTATVPNQSKIYTHDDNEYNRDLIWYKFDDANSYADVAAQTDVVVKDGDTPLTLGTDYRFRSVRYDDGTAEGLFGDPEKVGDKCLLVIEGMGDYAGKLYAPFRIIVPDANGTWGNLKWVYSDGTLTISKKDGVTEDVEMDPMNSSGVEYDSWLSIGSGIFSIDFEEGVKTIAAEAFGYVGDGLHHYSNLATVSLPSSLTEIGENAFAFCDGLTIDLDDILGNITIGNNAFNQIGCLTGALANNADNTTKIELLDQAQSNDITLSGRTLYKDGNWNTICLPFGLGVVRAEEGHHFDGTLFEGATVMELNGTDSDFNAVSGTLSLNFRDATSIIAGKPYIIKWASGDNLVNPEFTGVNVSSEAVGSVVSTDGNVHFQGTYSPAEIYSAAHNNLFLGNASTLYWPSTVDYTLGACRAYFHVDLSGTGAAVRQFVLNFGEEETTSLSEELRVKSEKFATAQWYSIDGRKLDGKPTRKGVYIHGGKKVVMP